MTPVQYYAFIILCYLTVTLGFAFKLNLSEFQRDSMVAGFGVTIIYINDWLIWTHF